MVAYSFKHRFILPIEMGLKPPSAATPDEEFFMPSKRQTIRAVGRRRHARAGDTLQLYHGMRSRNCFKIGEARCTQVSQIRIHIRSEIVEIRRQATSSELIEKPGALDAFARRDGFRDWADMRDFWREEHGELTRLGPFVGVLIEWVPL